MPIFDYLQLSFLLVNSIEKAGGKGYFYKCDVTNQQNVTDVAKEILKRFQEIDILVRFLSV